MNPRDVRTDHTTGLEGGGPPIGFGNQPVAEPMVTSDRRGNGPWASTTAASWKMPTSVHGLCDYAGGAALIVSPWLFGFATGGVAMWTPILAGAAIILYSLMTAYEWGLVDYLSMPTHLVLDFCLGVFLAASPWILGFSQEIVWPHMLFGLAEAAGALLTTTIPTSMPTRTQSPPQIL